jgi:hypothetical protein
MDRFVRYRGGDANWSNKTNASKIVNAQFFNLQWDNKLWIKVNGVWKECVAWIKVNGVWKKATPKIKNINWKQ